MRRLSPGSRGSSRERLATPRSQSTEPTDAPRLRSAKQLSPRAAQPSSSSKALPSSAQRRRPAQTTAAAQPSRGHLASAAATIAQSASLTNDQMHRLQGLTRHLRNNTDKDMQQRQVMQTNVEALVPIESMDLLLSEFQKRCCFGDRANLDLMSSSKWIKVLKDVGVVISDKSGIEKKSSHAGLGLIKAPEADLIFSKVLNGGDSRDVKRLTYGLFCKALYIVAVTVLPELPSVEAFATLVSRVTCLTCGPPTAACCTSGRGRRSVGRAQEVVPKVDEDVASSLDEDALQVLSHFTPALDDLFMTVCSRDSSRDAASSSSSSARTRERPPLADLLSWRASPGTGPASLGYPNIPVSYATDPGGAEQVQPRLEVDLGAAAALAAISTGAGTSSLPSLPVQERQLSGGSNVDVMPEILELECESDGGDKSPEAFLDYEPSFPRFPRYSSPLLRTSLSSIMESGVQSATGPPESHWNEHVTPSASLFASHGGRGGLSRQSMSQDQFLHICRELRIVPILLTRPEVLQILKRGQGSGTALPGFLSPETFMDVLAQCAVKAYSKPPYGEVYSRAHEKIYAFFVDVLPSSSRELHERFLYSRAAR